MTVPRGSTRWAEIVFCSMDDQTARLDCVGTSDGTRGWPFTVVVVVPRGAEWAELAARALARWAVSGCEVELRFDGRLPLSRVRIAGDGQALTLDVLNVLNDVRVS